jgi:TrmH family RNA methyltransferase
MHPIITSTKNPRLVELRKLEQRKYRQRQNRFMVEGLQLLGMAVEAMARPGWQGKVVPREVFYSESLFSSRTAPHLLQKLRQAGAETFPVDARVLNTLSDRDTSQGLIATFALAELTWLLQEINYEQLAITNEQPIEFGIQNSKLILILDQLQDPGNLGTLIRTADAVGARAVILLEPSVDPFDPKTIRSTMGSIFAVPLIRCQDSAACLQQVAKQGYRLVGADSARGTPVWQSETLVGPVGLVLGNEARGLSPSLHTHLEAYVSLPLLGRAESLNVAIAGAVLMYGWLRVNFALLRKS